MSKEKETKKEKQSDVTPGFVNAIQNYLESYAKEDKLFAKSLSKENKNIDDCCTYILEEVQKSKFKGFDDSDVFEMARHYYDEDDLKAVGPVIKAEIKWNEQTLPSDEEKAEIAKQARDKLFQEEIEKRKKSTTKKTVVPEKKEEKNDEPQTTLF